MFDNNLKTVYKHMLILQWFQELFGQELFGSQISVNTSRFELWIFCIWSNYLAQ